MTRCLLDMGERNRYKEPGFGLIMQRMDPMDMRRHQTYLTPQGRALWRRVLQTFE
jgi:DNA-binding MarR family transcriptional regulator